MAKGQRMQNRAASHNRMQNAEQLIKGEAESAGRLSKRTINNNHMDTAASATATKSRLHTRTHTRVRQHRQQLG